jgi:hypothetical protein
MTDFVGPAAARAAIAAILATEYPCMELPRGTRAEIARRVGISWQRAGHFIDELGATTGPSTPSGTTYECYECHKAFVRTGATDWGQLFCSPACRAENSWLRISCAACGREFRRRTWVVRMYRPMHGDLYCSLACANQRFAGVTPVRPGRRRVN